VSDTGTFAFARVSKTYVTGPFWSRRSVEAVKDVSFTIAAGETLAVVGESGSGKTTISNLCLGLVEPTSGDIRLGTVSLNRDRSQHRGQFAAVLQNPGTSLNPRFRIVRCIAEPEQILSGASLQIARERATEMMDRVGLSPEHAERFPHELSGGQRQRVAIARALVTSPSFIVFDEAVSALDVSVQSQVLNLIGDLQTEFGFSALFITHDLMAARYIAGRVAVMKDGSLIDIVPGADLYALSDIPYVRHLQECSGIG
jgi:ABC-type glutathione transport system ATPase component